MQNKYIWIIITVALLLIMLLFNKKVRLWKLFKEQVKVFKNDKKKKISPWDVFCFIIIPFIISFIAVYKLDFTINKNLAELLTTVFSVVFTVLFGFSAIMISKIDSQNKTEKQVAEETFVSIISSTILCLISAILSISLTQVKTELYLQLISSAVLMISLVIIMLLLLITKRVFILYIQHIK